MKETSKIHVFRLPIELRSENRFAAIACLKSSRREMYGLFVFFMMPEDRTKITIVEGAEPLPIPGMVTLTMVDGELDFDHAIFIGEFPEEENIFEVNGIVSMVYCGGQVDAYLEMFHEVYTLNLFEASKKSPIELVSEMIYKFKQDHTNSVVHLRRWDEDKQQYESFSADIQAHPTRLKEGMAMVVFQLGDVSKDDTEHGIPAQMDVMRLNITKLPLN